MEINFFENIESDLENEIIDIFHKDKVAKIERIISNGQSSPVDFWYDQDENEWVLLLEGLAIIEYFNGTTVELNKGDTLFIPKRKKHRVKYTAENKTTIWLALFYKS